MVVAFHGELGAFSEEAASSLWPNATPVPVRSVAEVVRAVSSGQADAGVLPVENTVAGGVVAAYDALATADELHAVAEAILRINQCLVAVPGATLADIRVVESHPIALAQCAAFLGTLGEREGGIEERTASDTASAAKAVAEGVDRRRAAIARKDAARRYGLSILAEHIEDRSDNQTRFLGVARAPVTLAFGTLARTSLMFTTANQPGALLRVLEPLARCGLNLSKLESRPTGEPWTYRFFADIDHDAGDDRLTQALELIGAATQTCRILGTYAKART